MDRETMKQEFLSTMDRRLRHCDELLRLANEQKSILTEGRHDDLADNISKLDPILLECEHLGKREDALRRHLMSGHEGADGLDPISTDARYRKLADLEADKIARLHTLTEANKHLLSNAMDLISFSMSIICQAATEHGLNGKTDDNPSLVLDQKV